MLYTVIFYNLILFFSTALLYVSEKEKTAIGRRLCLVLAFLVTVVPSAIRFEIGADYPGYVAIFEELAIGGMSYVEPGFLFLNKVINSLGLGYEWLFIVVAIFIHTFAFLSYPKKNKYIAHLFFMLLFYFQTFNILRQMMAIVVIMYAFKLYMQQRNDIRFYIMVVFASLFHTVALLFLFIPILNNRIVHGYIRHFSWTAIIFWGLAIVAGAFFVDLIINILSILPTKDYSGYFESARYSKSAEVNTGLGVLFLLFFCVYPLIYAKKFIEIDNKNILIFTLLIMYVTFITLQKQAVIFYRPKQALEFMIIPLVLMVLSGRVLPFRRLYIGMFFLFLFAIYNMSIVTSHTDYRITCNSGRLAPYVTIFNKEDSRRGSSSVERACYIQ